MDYADVAGKLLMALIIGAVIGLERESQVHTTKPDRLKPPPNIVGVRTFSLVTTLGTFSGIMLKDFFPIFVLIASAFIAILIAYYVLHSFITRDAGFTTGSVFCLVFCLDF